MTEIFIYLVFFPIIIAQLVGYWMLFEKAGENGWKALIPVYSFVIILKIVGRPWWWIFYAFIPLINVFVGIGVYVDLLNCFGKVRLKDHALGILFSFVYLPYIGSREEVKYLGTLDQLPEHKKSTAREWTEAIVFAVFAATLIRWLIMEAFTIPTPSMEKSLMVGDFLFVSKFHYGTRTPKTPLQMPLTHQKIWLTDLPSYVDWIQLEQYRLPGFTEVKRNDVVVFNVPGIAENNFEEYNRNKWIDYPVDLKTNYIKRCVALPGDVLKIEDQQVIVNGQLNDNPEKMQFSFIVHSKTQLSDRVLDKLGIEGTGAANIQDNGAFQVFYLTESEKQQLEELPFVISVKQYRGYEKGQWESNIFPSDQELFPWNADWYGPLKVPQAGETIQINRETLATYGKVITLYDHNENAEIKDGKLYIDGQEKTEYTFNQNYYFMMGDNRHNSLDSRYWGFVPEDHIVGKGFFIWLSLDANKSFLSKIRWRRFFQLIE